MKQFLFLFVTFFSSQPAFAQSSTFENNELIVPGVGVVDGDDASFYADVRLTYEDDGLFRIVGARNRNLVDVELVHIAVHETEPRQVVVSVKGFLSSPCIELLDPAISRHGSNFTVILAESALPEGEVCIAIAREQFTTAITLRLDGFGAGTYNVKLNDMIAQFTLETDG